MKIMLADYDRNRLDRLSEYIREIFPNDDITAETDSLMAAKNCFSTPYDIVFASLDDRRLDGLKMKGFVRHSNEQAKFCICGNAADLREWGVTDNYGNICEEGVDGAVSYPVTKEKLLAALGAGKVIPFESCIKATADKELKDDLLELAAGGLAPCPPAPPDKASPPFNAATAPKN